jgi:RNA polymerase sigma-70 factor (ECF subfamily)
MRGAPYAGGGTLTVVWGALFRRPAHAAEPKTAGRAEEGPGELLVRARSGDDQAFAQLVARHERRVLGLAWRLLGGGEEARDAAQEVFLRLFRHLHKVDPDRPLAAWLYRVTVNVCRDASRRNRRFETQPLEEAEEVAPAVAAEDPAHRALVREEHRILARGLSTLGEKERAALVLRDVEGLSSAEVAEILDSSPATVRSQISHARLKLARHRQRMLQPGGKAR